MSDPQETPPTRHGDSPNGDADSPVAAAEWLLVAILVIAGLGLRLLGAQQAPGFWYDEAIYALDGVDVATKPGWPVFFDTEGHMREGLFMYFLAVAFRLFGVSVEVARSTSSVIGALTIPAMWFMGREFGGRRAGLLCAFLGTFLCWHMHFSSLCFRTILTPLFSALSAGLLHRLCRRPGLGVALAAGVVLGLGAYTYLAWRLVPVILVAFGLFALWSRRRTGIAFPPARLLVTVPSTAIIVFMPLAVHFIRHPDHFSGRTSEVRLPGHFVERSAFMLQQAIDVALNYGVRGDPEQRHNMLGTADRIQLWLYGVPDAEDYARWQDKRDAGTAPDLHGAGVPVFDIVTAGIFYFGLALCLRAAMRGRPAEAAILAWMAIGSLASILSYGAPNLLRLTILIPAVVYILAIGLGAMLDSVAARFGSRAAGVILLLLLSHYTVVQVHRFHAWPRNPMTASAFNIEFATLGRHLTEMDARVPVVMPVEIWDHATLRFCMHGIERLPDTEFKAAAHPDGWIEVWTAPQWPQLRNPSRPGHGLALEDFGTVQTGESPWCRVVRVRPES